MEVVRDMTTAAVEIELLIDTREGRPPKSDQVLARGATRFDRLYHPV